MTTHSAAGCRRTAAAAGRRSGAFIVLLFPTDLRSFHYSSEHSGGDPTRKSLDKLSSIDRGQSVSRPVDRPAAVARWMASGSCSPVRDVTRKAKNETFVHRGRSVVYGRGVYVYRKKPLTDRNAPAGVGKGNGRPRTRRQCPQTSRQTAASASGGSTAINEAPRPCLFSHRC